MSGSEREQSKQAPISNGPNARPRDASISSTGEGIPNDRSEPIAVSEKEALELENKLRRE